MSDYSLPQLSESLIDEDLSNLVERIRTDCEKKGLPQKVLYVAFNFPPFADASSATVAKRIRQIGWPGEAIAEDLSDIRRTDDDLNSLIDGLIDRVHWVYAAPRFSSWPDIRDYVLLGYSKVREALENRRFGVMYSRALFPGPHFLAAYIKAKHPEVTWIAEFSDPVLHDVHGNLRASSTVVADLVSDVILSGANNSLRKKLTADNSVMAWCDALGIRGSDYPLFTNVNQATVMLQPHLDEDTEKAEMLLWPVVSPHPTLPKSFYDRTVSASHGFAEGKFHIGYFGEFYPNRGVDELLKALDHTNEHTRARVQVHIYTSSPDKAAGQIDAGKIERGEVTLSPSKPLFEFLELSKRMNALYVSDVTPGLGYEINPYLPSKLSDYRGADTPIIASVFPGSVMSRDKSLTQFLIGDVPGLAAHLAKMVVDAEL